MGPATTTAATATATATKIINTAERHAQTCAPLCQLLAELALGCPGGAHDRLEIKAPRIC